MQALTVTKVSRRVNDNYHEYSDAFYFKPNGTPSIGFGENASYEPVHVMFIYSIAVPPVYQ